MNKIKILVWGLGSASEKFLAEINLDKVQVLGVLDTYSKENNEKINGYSITEKENISKYEYDYIVIATMYSEAIYLALKKLDVKDEEMVFLYNYKDVEKIKYNENKAIIKRLTKSKILDYNKINLISVSKSGCNCRALFDNMPSYIKEKYEVKLTKGEINENDNSGTVISTHYNGIYDGRINIDLWHGFGIKSMGKFLPGEKSEEIDIVKEIDLFITLSKLSTVAMTAMVGYDPRKSKELGYPRNDLIFSKLSLKKLLGIEKDKKILLYMPTFRDEEKVKEIENIDKIKSELEKAGIVLIIKDHMYSNRSYKGVDNKIIYDLSSYEFKEDFYRYLNEVDCLITDYSSIYFDFLLLNKKIIFMIDDIEEYKKERGLLLGEYEAWAPGEIVENWDAVLSAFNREDKYIDKREVLKNIVHKYTDNNSSERVWKEIDLLISEKRRKAKG